MKKPSCNLSQCGFTLVELMVSMAIGLLIVLALITLLINVNRNNSEMSKTNRQIENGRFAIQLLQGDIVHAGFWGDLDYTISPAPSFVTPASVPAPCDVNVSADILAIPVQGYTNGSAFTACGVSSVLASSDVLLVRHANTCIAGSTNCEGGTDTGPHIQVSNCRSVTTPEASYVIAIPPSDPASASTIFPLKEKDCTTPVTTLRKIVTNIYYLSNSSDLPTLMRVSLVNGAFTTPQPLIEGIEAFRVEYGIDGDGNGTADSYVSCGPCDLGQLTNVVAVKIHVLARNLEPTPGYLDSKSYQLGAINFIPAVKNFKRHSYSTTVRLVNPSGRREVSP